MGAKIAGLDMVSSTEQGRDWLLKALHPTDPTVAGVSMPDGTCNDTVCMEYTTSVTLGPSSPGVVMTGPWGVQISLLPSIMPAAVYCTDGVTPSANTLFNVRYPGLSAATPNEDFYALMGKCEAVRICAASVTVHLDANATTDQGNLVACQCVTKPTLLLPDGGAVGRCGKPVAAYNYTIPFNKGDVPGYDAIMATPRAYQNNLREGIYMPLRLSADNKHWYSFREAVGVVQLSACTGTFGTYYSLPTTAGNSWPYYSCDRAYVNGGVLTTLPLCPMLSDTVGHIAIKNIHQTSSLVMKFRTCLEFKVQADSEFVPILKPSAPCDALAMESYFRILRQLEDAYPASYNASGKILSVIAKAVRTIGPLLAPIPGFGAPIAALSQPLASLADMGASYMARQKKPGAVAYTVRRKPVASTTTAHLQVPKRQAPKAPMAPNPNSKRSQRKAAAIARRAAQQQ